MSAATDPTNSSPDIIHKATEKARQIFAGVAVFLNQLIENIKAEGLKDGIIKTFDQYRSRKSRNTARRTFEINLVPDIKTQMLKTQKLRNLILFGSIVTISAMGGFLALLSVYSFSQNAIISGQKSRIEQLAKKVDSFQGLDNYLTLQGQFAKIAKINQQKNSLSRIFPVLSVILAQDRDKVSLSELKIDLSTATISFDGQADAGKEPFIDYRVLDAFSKAIALTKYDHGRYVSPGGKHIPARCVIDVNREGDILSERGKLYGLWYRQEKGCDPDKVEAATSGSTDQVTNDSQSSNKTQGKNDNGSEGKKSQEGKSDDKKSIDSQSRIYNSEPEKIWRTPKFEDWSNSRFIDSNGNISGVAHFESECFKYYSVNIDGRAHWKTTDNKCQLAADPEKGLEVIESSKGRDNSGELVLRFSARLAINPEVFKFKNKHVIAIAPSGQNVTDSYVQIKNMFEPRANDCSKGDAACNNAKKDQK